MIFGRRSIWFSLLFLTGFLLFATIDAVCHGQNCIESYDRLYFCNHESNVDIYNYDPELGILNYRNDNDYFEVYNIDSDLGTVQYYDEHGYFNTTIVDVEIGTVYQIGGNKKGLSILNILR